MKKPASENEKMPVWVIFLVCLIGVGVVTSTIFDKRKKEVVFKEEKTTAVNTANEEEKRKKEEEERRRIEQLPEFSIVSQSIKKIGFDVDFYYTDGAIYSANDKKQIGNTEYRIVVMGPNAKKIDTIRFQANGIQTREARQKLKTWAEKILSSLQKGTLPKEFVEQYMQGITIGNDGVSNGFCNVQVLQRPNNPNEPSEFDRISLDLIFDK